VSTDPNVLSDRRCIRTQCRFRCCDPMGFSQLNNSILTNLLSGDTSIVHWHKHVRYTDPAWAHCTAVQPDNDGCGHNDHCSNGKASPAPGESDFFLCFGSCPFSRFVEVARNYWACSFSLLVWFHFVSLTVDNASASRSSSHTPGSNNCDCQLAPSIWFPSAPFLLTQDGQRPQHICNRMHYRRWDHTLRAPPQPAL